MNEMSERLAAVQGLMAGPLVWFIIAMAVASIALAAYDTARRSRR